MGPKRGRTIVVSGITLSEGSTFFKVTQETTADSVVKQVQSTKPYHLKYHQVKKHASEEIHLGYETQGRYHHRSKPVVPMAPSKRTVVLQFFFEVFEFVTLTF